MGSTDAVVGRERVVAPEMPRRVSCVIPTLNEERNIAWVLERLPPCVDEVILVDASTDDTVAVSRAAYPGIRVVTADHPGKGAALRAGFAAASHPVIVMIDADRSMEPAEIEGFLDRLDQGFDLVKGSRFLGAGGTTDMEPLRRWGNAALRGAVNLLYGSRYTDLCYGFIAFRRSCLNVLQLRSNGFEIESEIVVKATKSGLRVSEVPSFESPRAFGTSNLNTWRDGGRVMRTLMRHRFIPVPAPAAAMGLMMIATLAAALEMVD